MTSTHMMEYQWQVIASTIGRENNPKMYLEFHSANTDWWWIFIETTEDSIFCLIKQVRI